VPIETVTTPSRGRSAARIPRGLGRAALATLALVASACGGGGEAPRPPGDTPLVTLGAISPAAARDGDAVTITYSADRAVESCAASFAGQPATCAPPAGAACSCTYAVSGTTPEGAAFVVATATHDGRTGTATGAGAVDRTPPAVDPAKLEIVRRALGADDAVAAAAAAVVDHGAAYPGARVVAVRLWDGAGALLAAAAPDVDGSFAPVDLPGTDGTTPATVAPAQVLASAVDAAGNESVPVAVAAGADAAGPVASPDAISIVRRALGTTDGVLGTAGAFAGPCAPTAVEVLGADDVLLGGAGVAGDGAFPEVAIGTGARSYPRAFVRASDKCGITGATAEVLAGRDVEPPAVDGARVVFHARPPGVADGVSGEPGAVLDALSAVAEVHLADAAGAPLAPAVAPALDGSLTAQGVGDTALDRVRVEAVDKAGNASAFTVSRKVEAVLGLAGRQPHAPGSAPAALYGFADPADPRLSAPGEALALGDEVDAAATAAATGPGGGAAHLAAGALPAGAGWTALAGGPRAYATAALDADRGVVVAFGGDDGVRILDETWEWDGARWARIETAHAPPARTGAAMIHDPVRRAVLLFGGLAADGTLLSDTWRYDGADWAPVDSAGAPPAREFAALVFDAAPGRERAVLFGGCGAAAPCELADTWELGAAGWSPVATPHAPPARFGAAAAYDAGRARTVIFGGALDAGAAPLRDLWEYDGQDWLQRSGTGTPPARALAAMAYDAGRGVLVLHGGEPAARGEETWELDGASAAWRAAPPSTAVGARSAHVLVHGDVGSGSRILAVGGGHLDDLAVLSYDGATWSAAAPALPAGRARAPMAYDALGGRLLVHGDGTDPFPAATDTWVATGATFARTSPVEDPALGAAALAYDAARGRVVLFGCPPGAPAGCGTWEDLGAGWTRVATAHLPPARTGHALAFDAARGRVVLFGGARPDGTLLGDTWRYDGTDWTPAAVSAAPTPRRLAALAYDAGRDRVVLFGGNDGALRDDTWELEATGWTRRQTASHPPPLAGAGLAYDPVAQAVTLWSDTGETWDLDGAGWSGPAPSPAGPRSRAALAFDPRRGALLLFGGITLGVRPVADLWALERRSGAPVWASHAAAFAIDPGATLAAASVRYGGAALGEAAGIPSFGVELLAWDWQAGAWVSVGTTDAVDPAAGVIAADLAGAARFCRDGRIALLAAPVAPSSPPGGAFQSEIWTDEVSLRVEYVLP
jgi:hypothetical protein